MTSINRKKISQKSWQKKKIHNWRCFQSIHADVAFSFDEYLWVNLNPNAKAVAPLNIRNFELSKGLVAQNKARTLQLIVVSANTRDIHGNDPVHLVWHIVLPSGAVAVDPFAAASYYGVLQRRCVARILDNPAHLVQSRIEALKRLAEQGVVSKLTHNMAYSLFAGSLVDYTLKYRRAQATKPMISPPRST